MFDDSMTTRYAVFLEPTGGLRDFLVDAKSRVEATLPGQTYCAHPPHSTLIHGAYERVSAWRGALCAGVKSQDSFQLVCSDTQVFYDDVLAGGGHTVAVRADRDPALAELQRVVANVLARHKIADPSAGAADWQGPMRASVDQYGFPFVGEHWIPHFTIASLKTDRDHPLLNDLLATSVHFTMIVDKVSVWSINDDEHEHLFDAPISS